MQVVIKFSPAEKAVLSSMTAILIKKFGWHMNLDKDERDETLRTIVEMCPDEITKPLNSVAEYREWLRNLQKKADYSFDEKAVLDLAAAHYTSVNHKR